MNISPLGLRFIAGHELPGGIVTAEYLLPYDDGAGIETIGIGHVNRSPRRQSITLNQAWEIFREDLQWVEQAVNSTLPPAAKQRHYDALCDFVFNVGAAEYSQSPVLQALGTRPLETSYVPSAMHLYTRGGGKRLKALIDRRTACEHLWFFGVYRPYNRGPELKET